MPPKPPQDLVIDGLTISEWNERIFKRGLCHKKDYQLSNAVNILPEKIIRTQKRLNELKAKPLLTETERQEYQIQIDSLRALRQEKRTLIKATKDRVLIEKLANEMSEIEGQMKPLQEELNRPDEIKYCEEKITRIQDKVLLAAEEIKLRAQKLVTRTIIGTTYYMDFNGATGTLTGTWTFANLSATVTANADGNALAELSVGDYIRVSDGTQWYKVTAVTNNNTFTISPAFQQTTVTDTTGASKYNDYDGTAIATPFVHLNQYTTDTVRSAGDTLKVRANQTHVYKNIQINFDEDGTVASYLTVKGCDSSDDPFGDASDVKPIINFKTSGAEMYLYDDNFWLLQNLDIRGNNENTSGGVFCSGGIAGFKIDSCILRGNTIGLYFLIVNIIACPIITNCNFYSNDYYNVELDYLFYSASTIFRDCTFDAGSTTPADSNIYIYKYASGYPRGDVGLFLENCSFSQTTATIYDIYNYYGVGVYVSTRNCKFNTELYSNVESVAIEKHEDYQQVKGDNKIRVGGGLGTITKDTSVTRVGGASSSALMRAFTSSFSPLNPLTIRGYTSHGVDADFKIWCPASTQTITIYIRSYGVWTVYPTASELFVEANYLDEGSGGHRARVVSNDVIADETTWVAFDVTLTPAQAGWVYLTVNLGKYEASKGIYVDIKPVIS